MFSRSSTVWMQLVHGYTKWIRILKSLGWSVQRIGHMCVHARDSVLCRTRAHAAGNGFVVRKRLACPRMRAGEESTDGEIVHRSGRGGRNQIRHGLRERA